MLTAFGAGVFYCYNSVVETAGAMKEKHTIFLELTFAQLIVPPKHLTRKEATRFYEQVAETLFNQVGYQYTPERPGVPPKVEMIEKYGRRSANKVLVDIYKQALRLLVAQIYPEGFDVATKNADQVYRYFNDNRADKGLTNLMEVCVRVQVPLGSGDLAFKALMLDLCGERTSELMEIGDVGHLGITLEIPAKEPVSGPLSSPKTTVRVEPLREDVKFIFIEVTSNWGRNLLTPVEGAEQQMRVVQGPLVHEILAPREYFIHAKEFIEEKVFKWLERIL